MDPKSKTFDAVDMSRELRETTSRLLESMSWEEQKETLQRARARFAARKVSRAALRKQETAPVSYSSLV